MLLKGFACNATLVAIPLTGKTGKRAKKYLSLCRRFDSFLLGHGGKAFDFFNINTKALADARSIIRVSLVKECRLPELDALLRILQVRHNVVHQVLSIHVFHYLAKQIARLHEIDISKFIGVAACRSGNIDGWRGNFRVRSRTAEAVRPVVGSAATVIVAPHGAVPLIAVHGAGPGGIDREEVVVRTKPVTMCIVVAEEAPL